MLINKRQVEVYVHTFKPLRALFSHDFLVWIGLRNPTKLAPSFLCFYIWLLAYESTWSLQFFLTAILPIDL